MAELAGPRPAADIERVHERRVTDPWWLVIEDAGRAVGQIGIWNHERAGEEIWEAGWMLRPDAHGRGIATKALAELLRRVREDGSVRELHAFPAVTNPASNALCARAGFVAGDVVELTDRAAPLRCRDWRLDL